MLENNYIDTSVQKGGVPGVPGCLEHKSVLIKITQEAKEYKGDLTVLWLDLANAYGVADWQRLEVGIVTGCTISVVLFSAAMNMLVKSAEKMSRGPVMSSGVSQPSTRAFIVDMTITAKSALEGKWMLQDFGELI
ncbi:Hypothetical predicted protein [Mytilus galloprovincialis]|uniref:Reverse transcriptase domain-containing protein n=1 Tax=Mytilus galloprovincialis TaxID=29158 RepID=A0A8B6BHI9_MYTGA|nr:Hypothetical predicted protein [Mytilus galloprovincialis]